MKRKSHSLTRRLFFLNLLLLAIMSRGFADEDGVGLMPVWWALAFSMVGAGLLLAAAVMTFDREFDLGQTPAEKILCALVYSASALACVMMFTAGTFRMLRLWQPRDIDILPPVGVIGLLLTAAVLIPPLRKYFKSRLYFKTALEEAHCRVVSEQENELAPLPLRETLQLAPRLICCSLFGLPLKVRVLFSASDFENAFTQLEGNLSPYLKSVKADERDRERKIVIYRPFVDGCGISWSVKYHDAPDGRYVSMYFSECFQVFAIAGWLISCSCWLRGEVGIAIFSALAGPMLWGVGSWIWCAEFVDLRRILAGIKVGTVKNEEMPQTPPFRCAAEGFGIWGVMLVLFLVQLSFFPGLKGWHLLLSLAIPLGVLLVTAYRRAAR